MPTTRTLTTHAVDSLTGQHAAQLGVLLYRLETDLRQLLVTAHTDAGGRCCERISVSAAHADATYQLVFQTRAYFQRTQPNHPSPAGLQDAVVNFTLPQSGTCHIPIMLAPSSYSLWCAHNP